jgi:hypothetical protein|tara:strand:+ start:7127 stop:7297 length:171 start_codon:yes stop_codon:yes gene_type:complete
LAETGKTKRVSFDLRGENAEAFEAWRKVLSSKLGFDVSPSKAVLWLMHQDQKGGDQ